MNSLQSPGNPAIISVEKDDLGQAFSESSQFYQGTVLDSLDSYAQNPSAPTLKRQMNVFTNFILIFSHHLDNELFVKILWMRSCKTNLLLDQFPWLQLATNPQNQFLTHIHRNLHFAPTKSLPSLPALSKRECRSKMCLRGRLFSRPRVKGTTQNVQKLSQPLVMFTKVDTPGFRTKSSSMIRRPMEELSFDQTTSALIQFCKHLRQVIKCQFRKQNQSAAQVSSASLSPAVQRNRQCLF